MRFDCYLLYLRPFLTSKSDLKIDQKSFKNYTGHKHKIVWWIFDIFGPQNEHLSKKGPKTGGGKMVDFLALRATWPPECSQEPGMGPQDRFGPQNYLKIVSKWNFLDEKS